MCIILVIGLSKVELDLEFGGLEQLIFTHVLNQRLIDRGRLLCVGIQRVL